MVVWGVIWMVAILVIVVTWYIVYIMKMAFKELNDGSNDTPKSEELLQLPSNRDQQSS